MQIDFATLTFTRARRTDPATSHAAAKHAATGKAALERLDIVAALRIFGPMHYRQIAERVFMEPVAVARRISECAGIERTGEVRDGCCVWRAL